MPKNSLTNLKVTTADRVTTYYINYNYLGKFLNKNKSKSLLPYFVQVYIILESLS